MVGAQQIFVEFNVIGHFPFLIFEAQDRIVIISHTKLGGSRQVLHPMSL